MGLKSASTSSSIASSTSSTSTAANLSSREGSSKWGSSLPLPLRPSLHPPPRLQLLPIYPREKAPPSGAQVCLYLFVHRFIHLLDFNCCQSILARRLLQVGLKSASTSSSIASSTSSTSTAANLSSREGSSKWGSSLPLPLRPSLHPPPRLQLLPIYPREKAPPSGAQVCLYLFVHRFIHLLDFNCCQSILARRLLQVTFRLRNNNIIITNYYYYYN